MRPLIYTLLLCIKHDFVDNSPTIMVIASRLPDQTKTFKRIVNLV